MMIFVGFALSPMMYSLPICSMVLVFYLYNWAMLRLNDGERERETGCSSWNPVPQCIRHLSATRMTAFTHGLIHSMEVALWDLSSKPGWSVRFRVSRYANSTRTFTSRYIEYVWFVYIRWGTMKLVDRWMDGYLRIHIRWVKCWPYRIPRMYPSHKGKLSSSGFHDGRSDGAAWRWVFGSSKLQC